MPAGLLDVISAILKSILGWLEPEMVTLAPNSQAASATAKPMPDVPPRMRVLLSSSFDAYFPGFGVAMMNG